VAAGEEEVRVLIVEDHWANRRLLEAMLKKKGPGYTMEAGVWGMGWFVCVCARARACVCEC
jgi:CheY-like chemotaxis protein